MELDRPHRPTPSSSSSTTTDLFICFTSRLSHSSSMRLSSKNIHSPGRTDNNNNNNNNRPPISLSTSLSRRMRTNNGSLKGGQSPMFPPGVSKKRGCAFENPEPSSPKVTCIGQVRVKTKKQGKKIKMAYKARRSDGGGVDVGNNNQSWSHLCDALSCFVPCKSSSCGGGGGSGKGQEREGSSGGSSCGGGVLRWLVAFHEGEGGKARDIELVVEEEEEERVVMERECSRRRSIFDDMDFSVGEVGNGVGEKEEGGRVSVCVPPKNALLLMRCRSDPVKMSALVNKFWESPVKEVESGREEEEGKEREEERRCSVTEEEKIESLMSYSATEEEKIESLVSDATEEEKIESLVSCSATEEEKNESLLSCSPTVEEKIESLLSCGGDGGVEEGEEEQVRVSVVSEGGMSGLGMLFEEPEGMEEEEESGQSDGPQESALSIEDQEEEIQETVIDKDSIFKEVSDQDPPLEEGKPPEEEEEEEDEPLLPDCLLLMMREPKLSMEVSKETWVCSTDFIRWLPESHRLHQMKKIKGGATTIKKKKDCKKNRVNAEPNNPNTIAAAAGYQPPRSSCSFPISMASLIEKKLVSAVAYEPFVLTRCKSEPMRAAAATKFAAAQELACFWKNRKVEPAEVGY